MDEDKEKVKDEDGVETEDEYKDEQKLQSWRSFGLSLFHFFPPEPNTDGWYSVLHCSLVPCASSCSPGLRILH